MPSLIRTDSILLNQHPYFIEGGVISQRAIYPQDNFAVQREGNIIAAGDLNPRVQVFEMKDFSQGIGEYKSDEATFNGKAWFSTLDHSHPKTLVVQAAREAAGQLTVTVNKMVEYNGKVYALTTGGLYEFDTVSNTFGITAGSPVTTMIDWCFHRGYLVLARGNGLTLLFFTGSAFVNPATSHDAQCVTSCLGHLFAVEPNTVITEIGSINGVKIAVSDNMGATWAYVNSTDTGQDVVLTSAYSPNNAECFADSTGFPQVFVALPDGVHMVDWQNGETHVLHDMTHNISTGNGKLFCFWPATRKIYVNERVNVIAIDMVNGTAELVGPEQSATPPVGIPEGLPDDYKAGYIESFTFNSNWLYFGTAPETGNYSLILKMSPDHKIYFVQRHYTADFSTSAMTLSGVDSAYRLYFAEGTGSGSLCRYLDWGDRFADEGELHTSWLAFGLPDVEKCSLYLTIEAEIPSGASIVLEQRTGFDELNGEVFATLTSADTMPVIRIVGTPPNDVGDSARFFKYVVKLVKGAGIGDTPKFYSLKVHWRPDPPPVYAYEMSLLLDATSVDPYAKFDDLFQGLIDDLEGECALSFVPSGDSADDPILVVVGSDTRQIKYEEARRTGKVGLLLVQVLGSTDLSEDEVATVLQNCVLGGFLQFTRMTVAATQEQEDISFAGMTVGVSVA